MYNFIFIGEMYNVNMIKKNDMKPITNQKNKNRIKQITEYTYKFLLKLIDCLFCESYFNF